MTIFRITPFFYHNVCYRIDGQAIPTYGHQITEALIIQAPQLAWRIVQCPKAGLAAGVASFFAATYILSWL